MENVDFIIRCIRKEKKKMAKFDQDIVLAENENIDKYDVEVNEYEKKRKLLENTRILKQTWSVKEIYRKIKKGELVLSPGYQRNEIWNIHKKTAFIESLFMEILVPPVYVVEVPSEKALDENFYEVVDGKQRLSTIRDFLENKFALSEKDLEYYGDIFSKKIFDDIENEENFRELLNAFLSSILDIYVITANSPEFTKYDIFSRLNRGSERLFVNELRKAIYRSKTLDFITEYVESYTNKGVKKELKSKYSRAFTKNDIKRYYDYGRFYRSLAFYYRSGLEKKIIGYNSRPREMIDKVLSGIQKGEINVDFNILSRILNMTLELVIEFKERKIKNYDHLIDVIIRVVVDCPERFNECKEEILHDKEVLITFDKSITTTKNVNRRYERICEIMGE